jgi:hypothetical protein
VVSEAFIAQEKIDIIWVFLGKLSLVVDGIISNQHLKCTIKLVEIMDSQVLAWHVKLGGVKPHLVVTTNMNNSSERNDNTTICII